MFGAEPSGEAVGLTDDEDNGTTAEVLFEIGQPIKPTIMEMLGIGPSGDGLELADCEAKEDVGSHGELPGYPGRRLAHDTRLTFSNRPLMYRATKPSRHYCFCYTE